MTDESKSAGVEEPIETDGPSQEEPKPEAAQTSESEQLNLSRPSAEDIYKQVEKNATEELKRSTLSLAISGFTGGTFMGLSALGVGIILAHLAPDGVISPTAFVVSRMFYPLGFIVVILGRSQLFTENTLYPVALVLTKPKAIWHTIRLWATVLPSNVCGALAFAALAGMTHAMPADVVKAMAQLGMNAAHDPTTTVFWSGVVGGWIIATAAWLVSGSHSITGSVMVIWMLTFVVGLGNFAHCIATSGEILTAVLTHQLPWAAYPHWFGPAVAGNICGGVGMVTLLEYGQARLSQNSGEADETTAN
jgi:formate/nitrite transporter FocA (FNT family)